MEGIFQEFYNANELRSYPFASGCVQPEDAAGEIPCGVFVDAMMYPVNPVGTIYISEISADGVVSVSDDTGVIMTGTARGKEVVFRDVSPFARRVGTMYASSEKVLSEFLGRGVERSYSRDSSAFAASCVFPVVIDGVVSVSVGDAGAATGRITFSNGTRDTVRVSSKVIDDEKKTIRFDVLATPKLKRSDSIRRIICVVDGQTPFRIDKLAYNVILLTLHGIDREAVCSAAHREDSFDISDTYGCDKNEIPRVEPAPEHYHLEEVLIPPDSETGSPVGSENAFYLVVSNVLGYNNPLSITLDDGNVSPNTEDVKVVSNGGVMELEEGALIDKVTSKGVIIQVPGLSGGMT